MLFDLGRVVANKTALAVLEELGVSPLQLIARHATGDWGDLDEHDKKLNDDAVRLGNDRILSRYNVGDESFYIVTEWNRSYTTLMLCSEY